MPILPVTSNEALVRYQQVRDTSKRQIKQSHAAHFEAWLFIYLLFGAWRFTLP
ncbi:hypothetical protein L910_3881 [Vibrio fluvialis PG41]|uniref:Uncharacterized protein n=1 Tax=Vibrio fluvialis PG41 TaxID=1336752 RepID=S7I624_VIBFL|nr:hypothetical protein L910_3881 [Vibrio fluvialis PG41]